MGAFPAGAADPTAIGLVPAGQTMFTFVGKIDQNGTLADDVGYLTSVAGLDEGLLFVGGDPLSRTESTARLTYFASAKLLTRSINGNVFITSGTAETTLYLSRGGASFDDPASFKSGEAIATFQSRWQDIVNVQSPNKGVATVTSDETQRTASTFTLGGAQYLFGRAGLRFRLNVAGEGTRTDPTAPRASILYGGNAVPLPQAGLPAPSAATGGTSGWAYAGFGVGIAALVVALGSLAMARRGRAASV